jgi:predicted DNA-binding ArsR family transcriptional regulator
MWIFAIVNFVSVMILYAVILYVFALYAEVRNKIEELEEYRITNERQLNNLVRDINYNDRHIAAMVRAKD